MTNRTTGCRAALKRAIASAVAMESIASPGKSAISMGANPHSTSAHVLGVIGGSTLVHTQGMAKRLTRDVIETEFGGVVVHRGVWQQSNVHVVFIQRHHANPDGLYKLPREINFRAIAAALKICQCDAVIGLYSVGSMNATIGVGRIVIPEDYFNPFDIMHISRQFDAHVVPDMNAKLRAHMLDVLSAAKMEPYDGGVYIQTAGPRFETKAEIRFFKQFGELIGMTGANEAELLNELHIPFAMCAIVDNLANGIGTQLTVEAFKQAQKDNATTMERALVLVLDSVAAQSLASVLLHAPPAVQDNQQEQCVCVDA